MTAAQLWFLIVLALQLITDAVEQLDVTLVGVLAQRRDEGPRHSSRSFTTDTGVGPENHVSNPLRSKMTGETYEVCVSLDPLHIMTSAGLVFVLKFFLYTSSPLIAFLKRLVAPPIMLPISPRA
jgi:hypothetical protein